MTSRSGAEASPPDDPVLAVEDLSFSYGGVMAVRNASVVFRRNEITGLIGPNGAGKTTMLNLLTGTLMGGSGKILFNGRNVSSLPAYRRARLGMRRTFQISSEFKRLTVVENLLCGTGMRGETLRSAVLTRRWWGKSQDEALDRARTVLDQLGLTRKADEVAGTLSGGERRLIEIGRVLMSRPDLVLLDEPLAGVHPRMVDRVVGVVKGLRDSGTSLIMTLHEPGAIERTCDRVAVMSAGSVIAVDSFERIRSDDAVLLAYLGGRSSLPPRRQTSGESAVQP
jgi:ABC-type branched-subunit amino acid transport system ATPase component